MSSRALTRTREAGNNFQSEIHQLLGDVKIQEISEHLDEKEKDAVDNILSALRLEDLTPPKQLTRIRFAISMETEELGIFKRKRITKVIGAISDLLYLKQEMLLMYKTKK